MRENSLFVIAINSQLHPAGSSLKYCRSNFFGSKPTYNKSQKNPISIICTAKINVYPVSFFWGRGVGWGGSDKSGQRFPFILVGKIQFILSGLMVCQYVSHTVEQEIFVTLKFREFAIFANFWT